MTEAIRLDPKWAVAYYNRGSAYEKRGEIDKSIADYTKAIRLNPTLARAYYNRGLAYSRNGDKTKAEEDFAQAKKLGYPILPSPTFEDPSENPPLSYVPVPAMDVPELSGPFYLLPNEPSVPRTPMQGPQPVPDEPTPTR